MKIIAITNNKGGVGKTTSAVSIGSALLAQGHRVLLVDLDMQSNLTTHVGGNDLELDAHVGDVLIGSCPAIDAILESESGIDFLPATRELSTYEPIIYKKKDYHTTLRRALAPLADQYDYALIDCPPNLQTYTYAALVAADAYVIPAEPEKFSYDGLRLVKELADQIERRLNPGLIFLGIFFTRFNPKLRNKTHRLVGEAIVQEFGDEALLPHVRKDSLLVQAQVETQTIHQFAPASNGAQDYDRLAQSIVSQFN